MQTLAMLTVTYVLAAAIATGTGLAAEGVTVAILATVMLGLPVGLVVVTVWQTIAEGVSK